LVCIRDITYMCELIHGIFWNKFKRKCRGFSKDTPPTPNGFRAFSLSIWCGGNLYPMQNCLIIKGAKEHNLKNINLRLPRDKLIVVTGLSGSGKSSLAFDTIYAEGQRRYVESLSAYARQFLEQLQKPDVESIEGLSPAIAIEQRSAGGNPRSIVGTQTEIYDYLRLLFARIGRVYCPECAKPIQKQSAQEIVARILALGAASEIQVLAPLVRGRKGEYKDISDTIQKAGFVRCRIDGVIYELPAKIKLRKYLAHNIEVVVDRLIVKPEIKNRLTDSVETALKVGKGIVIIVHREKEKAKSNKRKAMSEMLFSEHYACVNCGMSFAEIEPRIFSFNSPYGACPDCNGLGTKLEFDPDLIVPDRSKSINQGAIEAWKRGGRGYILYYRWLLRELSNQLDFDLDMPFRKLPKPIQKAILYGSAQEVNGKPFEGVIPHLERLFRSTESDYLKEEISRFMSTLACPVCLGARLKKESLSVKIDDKNIWEVTRMSIKEAEQFFSGLKLNAEEKLIAHHVLKEIIQKLRFCIDVGLEYLTLDRKSATLAGGEAQRIRLATQVGSGLVEVLYILDEPSIGLHQRDNAKLLSTLCALRDLGNTLIVVEHDEFTIRAADYIVDLGPGAGRHGGEIVFCGPKEDLLKDPDSLTAKYLRRELKIEIPAQRRPWQDKNFLEIKGAREHNLKNIDIKIPLGVFICVTGVSGSGKSTLIDEILYRSLSKELYQAKEKPGLCDKIIGTKQIDKVIEVDQSPIGRTPRSNPATYTGVFSYIRDVFSRLPEARTRGYKPGRFSFNVKGGRCEACQGDGIKKIEMHFLPDIYVRCEVCHGRRFNEATLEVKYKGKSIAEVLNLTVEEALDLFANIPRIKNILLTLYDVGLGYIQLGQSATTLSGGEAQRVKLSAELSRRSTGKTLYILDEPTTGLHFADVEKLIGVLQRLVDKGNTVLVVEHNLEVVKCADYIIDLGPEGGDQGGELVASGSPEELIKNKNSHTAEFLKNVLNNA
jgi:excinuclease ABC subunit A